mgnify:CR=1 FL=1
MRSCPQAPEQFYAYVTLLALLSGLFQLGFGVARAELLLSLVSHPVLMGFINAAALIIAMSQLPGLLGISTRQSGHLLADTWHVITRMDTLHAWSLGFGLAAIAMFVAFRKFAPRLPGVLISVAILTVVSEYSGIRGAWRSRSWAPFRRPSRRRRARAGMERDHRAAAGCLRHRPHQLHGGHVELQGDRQQDARAVGREPGAGRAGNRQDRGGASASRCR